MKLLRRLEVAALLSATLLALPVLGIGLYHVRLLPAALAGLWAATSGSPGGWSGLRIAIILVTLLSELPAAGLRYSTC